MYKLSLPFLFTLPLTVLGTSASHWIASHHGDLIIEGQAHDKGEDAAKDDRYHYSNERIMYKGADVTDLFKWLIESTTYTNIAIREAIQAHITKMFQDLEDATIDAANYVAVLSESEHSHSNHRQFLHCGQIPGVL